MLAVSISKLTLASATENPSQRKSTVEVIHRFVWATERDGEGQFSRHVTICSHTANKKTINTCELWHIVTKSHFKIKNEWTKHCQTLWGIRGLFMLWLCCWKWHLIFEISLVTTNERSPSRIGHCCQFLFAFVPRWMDSKAVVPPQCNSWLGSYN